MEIIKLLKANKLKEEYFSFFWKRVGLGLVIGFFMWLFTLVIPPLNNEIVRNFLNIVITYLLSSEILRRMINSNASSLTMELNEMNKEVLDPMDMIKMYWSFYWRETLIELVFIIIFFLLFRGIRFISLLPAIITLLILSLVLSYYVGRYVFKYVISSVW